MHVSVLCLVFFQTVGRIVLCYIMYFILSYRQRRSLLETRDFHSRRGMGARTIAWGRCTPLTIVDQFGIKISGFTPSFDALGRLLKENSKIAYERFLV